MIQRWANSVKELCTGHTKRILALESEDVGSYLFICLAVPFFCTLRVGRGPGLSTAPEQPQDLSLLS